MISGGVPPRGILRNRRLNRWAVSARGHRLPDRGARGLAQAVGQYLVTPGPARGRVQSVVSKLESGGDVKLSPRKRYYDAEPAADRKSQRTSLRRSTPARRRQAGARLDLDGHRSHRSAPKPSASELGRTGRATQKAPAFASCVPPHGRAKPSPQATRPRVPLFHDGNADTGKVQV
jgi:hypothetical protein